MSAELKPGATVRCRGREWVLLPSSDAEVFRLRPLTGTSDEPVEVSRALSNLLGYTLPSERVAPAQFPLPRPERVLDAVSVQLLWDATRLMLREGASPLRSMGRLSIRPHLYQLVPLLMALRQSPVRLLIADDVGVGKTIEAALIARELWERGDIERLAVLCPPYLCDQWQRELSEKFNLPAVVVNSSTLAQLERAKPGSVHLYEHYPVLVISIDWVKSERNRYLFLEQCPELVIVDEVHNAIPASAAAQQRYQLVYEVASQPQRHLILLTATPHSGIPDAFQKLLGLLDPQFERWAFDQLSEAQRERLARHFVLRTRADIEREWGATACFPKREIYDVTYPLSPQARQLFAETYDYCLHILPQSGQLPKDRTKRAHYWAALALLRSVMSSPAAALQAIRNRSHTPDEAPDDEETDALARDYVDDLSLRLPEDEAPSLVLERATLTHSEQQRLRAIAKIAEQIITQRADTKVDACCRLTQQLLREGFMPIIWCRFIATAEYVADHLRQRLAQDFPDLQVVCLTGRQSDDERRMQVDAIDPDAPRVLVATDCLAEGINLQEKFSAAIHYDLPWNPNKLEQREGRVDRFGQRAPTVRTYRLYSPDNPVDGLVIKVLLEKAREIRKTLGAYVPVPEDSPTLIEALVNAMFLSKRRSEQLALDIDDIDAPALEQLTLQMHRDAEREHANRTRFAQRALKPDEIRAELEAVDQVLGSPELVQRFVRNALQRLGTPLHPDKRVPDRFVLERSTVEAANLPPLVRHALPELPRGQTRWYFSFVSPTPPGAVYLGRNHPLVQALARYLFEAALDDAADAPVARCGAIATDAVQRPTACYLLRQRYLLQQPSRPPQLAEETRLLALTLDDPADARDHDDALALFADAQPRANLTPDAKQRWVQRALERWQSQPAQDAYQRALHTRTHALQQSHQRLRTALQQSARALQLIPQQPPDLIGVLALVPLAEVSR
jgi:superfamily II DNA or RNA helicase